MRVLFTTILTFFITTASTQQLYKYYEGYKDGFQRGCGCTDKPPMASDLLYESGSYDDGYFDGRVDGRSYLNNSEKSSETDLAEPDYELIKLALEKQQAILNQRRQHINESVEKVWDKIEEVQTKNGGLTEGQKKYNLDFYNQLGEIEKWDFTNYQNYANVINWINKIYKEVSSW